MRIIVSYRGVPGRPGWATGDSVARALVALGHEVYRYGNVYQSSERIDPNPIPWTPDLLLWMECNDGDPQYLELLELLHCPKVMWDFDTAMHREQSFALAERFDRRFWANLNVARERKEPYLPYAFDDELMRSSAPKTSKIAIIGTPFPERAKFAKEIGVEMISGVYGQDYVDAVAGLLCHVHHYDSGGSGLMVGRIWETMGLGTCLLAARESIYDPLEGDPMLTYDSSRGATTAVRGLRRSDPAWAIGVGRRARECILSHHTYRHRVAQLLEQLP